jgi:N-acylglucosamine 2-epimerase
MDDPRARELADLYCNELVERVIPFWEHRSPAPDGTGFFSCFDRQGTLYDTNKYVWLQGRFVWMFCRIYNDLEPRQGWLEAARHGLEFINRHCFDETGRMYFAVSEHGQRLTRPWGIFSECFTICALAQYARATGDDAPIRQARQLLDRTLEMARRPDLDTLSYPENPPMITHAIPMILLNVIQELRAVEEHTAYDQISDEMLHRILDLHAHPEERALFENVRPDGTFVNTPDGRVINPGHALESAWFLLHEARYRSDDTIRDRAVAIIEWSLERGWDDEYGGLLYFLDSAGFPSPYLEWDMKLWWVHIEALYAVLLAHHLTGREDLLEWFERIHTWTWEHFPDPDGGEWFGYLSRTGEPALTLKGSMWKGFYHLPRGLLLISELLDEMTGRTDLRCPHKYCPR